MRVISQREEYDIPYEISTLWRDVNVIWAVAPQAGKIIVAQYSTQEKAEKAMKMLHEEYVYAKQFETICSGSQNYSALPSYWFQFPQEDEI